MTSFNSKLEKLKTQLAIDVCSPVVYGFFIIVDDGKGYRYVGQTTNYKYRHSRYTWNVRNIRDRICESYRAVHFALYEAIENDWDILNCVKPCSKNELNDKETQFICKLKCNLNNDYNPEAIGWKIEDLDKLTMETFVPTGPSYLDLADFHCAFKSKP